MNPRLRADWIAALRSGHYTQGLNTLRDRVDGQQQHCCLGVLCELALRQPEVIPSDVTITSGSGDGYGSEDGIHVTYNDEGDQHLTSTDLPPGIFGLTQKQLMTLMDHNDGRHSPENEAGIRWTFSQIADWIEANIPIDSAPTPAPDVTTT